MKVFKFRWPSSSELWGNWLPEIYNNFKLQCWAHYWLLLLIGEGYESTHRSNATMAGNPFRYLTASVVEWILAFWHTESIRWLIPLSSEQQLSIMRSWLRFPICFLTLSHYLLITVMSASQIPRSPPSLRGKLANWTAKLGVYHFLLMFCPISPTGPQSRQPRQQPDLSRKWSSSKCSPSGCRHALLSFLFR